MVAVTRENRDLLEGVFIGAKSGGMGRVCQAPVWREGSPRGGVAWVEVQWLES